MWLSPDKKTSMIYINIYFLFTGHFIQVSLQFLVVKRILGLVQNLKARTRFLIMFRHLWGLGAMCKLVNRFKPTHLSFLNDYDNGNVIVSYFLMCFCLYLFNVCLFGFSVWETWFCLKMYCPPFLKNMIFSCASVLAGTHSII